MMRGTNTELAKDWRRSLAQLNELLEAAAIHARREVQRIASSTPIVEEDHGFPP